MSTGKQLMALRGAQASHLARHGCSLKGEKTCQDWNNSNLGPDDEPSQQKSKKFEGAIPIYYLLFIINYYYYHYYYL